MENCPLNSHTWSRHITNLSVMYDLEDPAKLISLPPPSKSVFRNIVHTKITVYHEKKLRTAATKNSKMTFLNVSIKGLNGRPHPALSGITTTHSVKKSRAHLKMLADDLYNMERSLSIRVGLHSVM